jgi:multicomponent Na+:H+ antiporter subunit F
MELITQYYEYFFWGVLVVLAVCSIVSLIYVIRAHLTVDRIIGINLISTIVVIMICILAKLLGEDYLVDIAVIYVVLSFIAVLLLCRIYINLFDKEKGDEERNDR